MMSKKIRKILYPLSVLYGGITKARNKLYDKKIFKSSDFDVPTVLVGNLRVGGTGKTPQIAYLVSLLKHEFKVAVLSRGYKRQSKGFVLADKSASVANIGDEPFQLYRQHSDIIVAVDADRVRGIDKLQSLENKPDIILLDDAFQHRKINAGFSILLTSYDDLYVDDAILPSGNLRENIEGADRAEVIIVTKCPDSLSEKQEYETAIKLNPSLNQTVFFTKISYASKIKNEHKSISVKDLKNYQILLLTGIAKPKPLLKHIDEHGATYIHKQYKDHHNFSKSDLQDIKEVFDRMHGKKKLILTTEKDYVRIFDVGLAKNELYYLAIETTFINHQKDFDKLILDYVGENTRNS